MDDMNKTHCINVLNLKTKKNIKKEKVAEFFSTRVLGFSERCRNESDEMTYN